jgi:hypothetical protein
LQAKVSSVQCCLVAWGNQPHLHACTCDHCPVPTHGPGRDLRHAAGFISGVHIWLVRVNNLSEPDSVFIGVGRGSMSLDQDPQDLRDRTYYLSNGVIRVAGRRVQTRDANFSKNDIIGVVLDADQGEIVFLKNFVEQGRAKGIRGRLFPFVSFDSEGDQVTLLGASCGVSLCLCFACLIACLASLCLVCRHTACLAACVALVLCHTRAPVHAVGNPCVEQQQGTCVEQCRHDCSTHNTCCTIRPPVVATDYMTVFWFYVGDHTLTVAECVQVPTP